MRVFYFFFSINKYIEVVSVCCLHPCHLCLQCRFTALYEGLALECVVAYTQ